MAPYYGAKVILQILTPAYFIFHYSATAFILPKTSTTLVHPHHSNQRRTTTRSGNENAISFHPITKSATRNTNTPHGKLQSSTNHDLDYKIQPCGGDDTSMNTAANFMMDSFWLQPPHVPNDSAELSDSSRSGLLRDQMDDLLQTYGERMGKRTLESVLLAAYSDGECVGLVGVEMALLNKDDQGILNYSTSEQLIKKTVAKLGPKERRMYKNSPIQEIVTELLPGMEFVAVLSNLSVSVRVRGKGLGSELCLEAEKVVKNDWGMNEMILKVEGGNEGARGLYEKKLGYELIFLKEDATMLRVDVIKGEFVEETGEVVVLRKYL